ncbi:M28 family metallopeptidase [Clostridium sp. CTA-5]
MKKFIYHSSLFVLFICLTFSVFIQTTYYHFNPSNVKYNIKLISSNEYEGRLTGTCGNEKVASLIENFFKNNKILPFNNSYKESFEVTTPIKNNKTPELKIAKNNTPLHEYQYGVDFKEDMLNFNENSVVFTKQDTVDILPSSLVIKHNDKRYLFYVSLNKDFSFRSSFNDDAPYEFSIAITTELFNDILDSLRSDKEIIVTIPYSEEKCITSNIIGKIKGSSKDLPPLILTAHFDHIGVDNLDNYYNGALDNASGTAFLLELSKNLSSFMKPKRDIIFVALTGEEFGLLGSSHFTNEYKDLIKNSNVINFDMIGAPNTPISLMSGSCNKDNGSELLDSLKEICDKKNIDYKITFADCSDHASFAKEGIDSVTLCHSDTSKIHTPNDTVEFIDTSAINEVYSIVEDEIYNYAYNDFILFLYNPNLILFLFIAFIIVFFFPTFKKKLKVYINKKKLK